MKPAFSNALYYPSIDIQDSNWLKTAALFWDSISTIVAVSESKPYKKRDTQYLESKGFLTPIVVDSNDSAVVSIERQAMDNVRNRASSLQKTIIVMNQYPSLSTYSFVRLRHDSWVLG